MNLFCKHNWKVLTKTYEPEFWEYEDPGGMWIEMVKRKRGDITTVLLKCTKCPAIKKETMKGECK